MIKFVLHTNIPGQFDFGIYNRVNFAITAECQNTLVESMQPERSSTIIIQTNSKVITFDIDWHRTLTNSFLL